MKISKCKKELARIISEHGGWRYGEFAAQDGDGGVGGYGEKPAWSSLGKYWRNEAFGEWFLVNKIKNHHQTVLSRAEYFHLYPSPDADGWIEWKGGECPVGGDVIVCCKLRSGKVSIAAYRAGSLSWRHNGNAVDIIAYRLHKQQPKPEFCESVMGSIPEPEAQPIIEQLAADYRNAKDYALRLQEETNDAWTAAEKAKGELIDAGKALGLVLSVAEPELVITDWRDLRVNDVIFVGEYDDCESGEYVVIELEGIDYGYDYAVKAAGMDGNGRWIYTTREWRVIRRP